jgi:hypothetical protein
MIGRTELQDAAVDRQVAMEILVDIGDRQVDIPVSLPDQFVDLCFQALDPGSDLTRRQVPHVLGQVLLLKLLGGEICFERPVHALELEHPLFKLFVGRVADRDGPVLPCVAAMTEIILQGKLGIGSYRQAVVIVIIKPCIECFPLRVLADMNGLKVLPPISAAFNG